MSAEEPTADRSGSSADRVQSPADQAVPPSRWPRLRQWWRGDEPTTPRQAARSRALQRGFVAGGVLTLAGSIVTLPLLVLGPGPTYNTIGEVDGVEMITISGTTTYPTGGNLDMTTVSERGGSSGGVHLAEALVGWLAADQQVVPRETYYPPDESGEEVAHANDQLFALSQSNAIAAAMGEMGIPTEDSVVVTTVQGGSPADGIVQAGDWIVAVDGVAVTTPGQVGDQVRTHQVGDTVTLDVRREPADGGQREPVTLEVVTAANPEAAAADPTAAPVPYLGIEVDLQHEAPFDIEFNLDNVGGPSAGMMFSLAIVDMLTKGELTGGGHVAGTGTIDPDGGVGAIGGIEHKMIGAQRAGAGLFLAPEANCADVVGHEPPGLTVVPVATLSDARDIVARWAADHAAEFASCEARVSPARVSEGSPAARR